MVSGPQQLEIAASHSTLSLGSDNFKKVHLDKFRKSGVTEFAPQFLENRCFFRTDSFPSLRLLPILSRINHLLSALQEIIPPPRGYSTVTLLASLHC
jgi:hypothetical protein